VHAGRTALLGLSLLGLLSFGGSAPAQPFSDGMFVALSLTGTPTLDVEQPGQRNSGIAVVSSEETPSPGEGPHASRVAIQIPAGHGLKLSRSTPGLAFLSAAEVGEESGSLVFIFGLLVSDDPGPYATDPQAQACDPAPHRAVWRFAASVLGVRLDMPVFVDAPPAGDSTNVAQLVFCAPVPRLADGSAMQTAPIKIGSAVFILDSVSAARQPGSYVWRAFVTPLEASTSFPNPGGTFELRATVPVPQRLTLHGKYERATERAVLSGKLTSAGKPRRGAKVAVVATGPRPSDLQLLGSTRTDASGSFRFRTSISKTTIYVASVGSWVGSCQGPSTAPAGCRSNTVSSAGDARTRVVVPKRRHYRRLPAGAERPFSSNSLR